MPERSEWLLAEGAAKRNPRYRDTPHDAKNANITFNGGCFRVLRFSLGDGGFPGVALTLNPRLRATRSARAFDLSGRAAVIRMR